MKAHLQPTVVRRWRRLLAVVPAFGVASAAGPAFASPPESWEDPTGVTTLHALLLLGGVPVLLFLVIWFLVYLPSLVRGQEYDPATAFRDEPEWFGGPRQGLEAVKSAPGDAGDRGGASAHW